MNTLLVYSTRGIALGKTPHFSHRLKAIYRSYTTCNQRPKAQCKAANVQKRPEPVLLEPRLADTLAGTEIFANVGWASLTLLIVVRVQQAVHGVLKLQQLLQSDLCNLSSVNSELLPALEFANKGCSLQASSLSKVQLVLVLWANRHPQPERWPKSSCI